jgi:SAM-dependent methyltransferase
LETSGVSGAGLPGMGESAMNDVATSLPRCSPVRGLMQVLRFNWTRYLIGALGLAFGLLIFQSVDLPIWTRYLIVTTGAVAAWWLFASAAASYWIYDLSGMYLWRWLVPLLAEKPKRWVNIHAGFDDTTESLRAIFPVGSEKILDIYDSVWMTEPSLNRARASMKPVRGTEKAAFDCLPINDSAADTVFLLFAAHEIRDSVGRQKLFGQLHRSLVPGGRVIIVEHLRDLMNFLAFGPGFRHFYSRREWLCLADGAGFQLEHEESATPFVGCFVFRKKSSAQKERS